LLIPLFIVKVKVKSQACILNKTCVGSRSMFESKIHTFREMEWKSYISFLIFAPLTNVSSMTHKN